MKLAIYELLRVVVVIALVCLSAALATPRGKLPLALRGVYRILRRDAGQPTAAPGGEKVSVRKRLLAFFLVLVAIGLALVG